MLRSRVRSSGGTRVPASDPRTDHVATLDIARNLLIHVHSVGINGKSASGRDLIEQDACGKVEALGGGVGLRRT